MAAPKLTKTEQDHIIAWLIEGLTSQAIVDNCVDKFGKKLAKQTIDYYLRTHYDEVIAGQKEAFELIKTKGICVLQNRIKTLQEHIDNLQDNLIASVDWDKDKSRQVQDLIKLMTFLQNQLGELTGQQIIATDGSTATITIQIPSFGQEDVINDS